MSWTFRYFQGLGILNLITGVIFFTLGCHQESHNPKRNLLEAQTCLNRLNNLSPSEASSQVFGCLEKIWDDDSPEANLLKCSAVFIQQEFSSFSKLQLIVENMQESSSNSDQTLATIGLFAFSKPPSPVTAAEEAHYYCTRSKSKGLAMLASLSKMATYLNSALGNNGIITSCTPDSDPTTCAQKIKDACTSSDLNSGQFGTALLTLVNFSCSNSNNPFCNTMKNNIQNQSNPEAATQEFINEFCQ